MAENFWINSNGSSAASTDTTPGQRGALTRWSQGCISGLHHDWSSSMTMLLKRLIENTASVICRGTWPQGAARRPSRFHLHQPPDKFGRERAAPPIECFCLPAARGHSASRGTPSFKHHLHQLQEGHVPEVPQMLQHPQGVQIVLWVSQGASDASRRAGGPDFQDSVVFHV